MKFLYSHEFKDIEYITDENDSRTRLLVL
ncbi:DUF2691 family protein [Terrilactibacillus laevilacticus]|uniref:DUF2691 family protein n=1 Tax=Terrilactibacillus laevilacticus TaxID=1380157 RepID=A0ABW5PLD7_9BACI